MTHVTSEDLAAALRAIGRAIAHVADRHALDREAIAAALMSAPLGEPTPTRAVLTGLLLPEVVTALRSADRLPGRH